MKDNKGFWNGCAGIYDKIISADKNTYAHILSRMKHDVSRESYEVLKSIEAAKTRFTWGIRSGKA